MQVYKVGDLKKVIREGIKDFKPVFGQGVEAGNKKNNEKAYSAAREATKNYDGGLTRSRRNKPERPVDDNWGMSDLQYDSVSSDQKKRFASQMKGHTSVENEKLHKNEPYGNADYGTDDDVKRLKDHAQAKKDGRDKATEIGLTGRELDKKEVEKLRQLGLESKQIKRLKFKRVTFLSEGHMLSNIPDDYKKEGNKFLMKDNSDNEYLVEWHKDAPNVTKKPNLTQINEEKERMKKLWNYEHQDFFKSTTAQSRIQENDNFSDVLNKARKLMK